MSKLDQLARVDKLEDNAATSGRDTWLGLGGGEADVLMWLNYLTFDIISDLAFGEPLGMLDRESDMLGDEGQMNKKSQPGIAAMIDYRGRTAAFLGLFPYLLPESVFSPLTRWIPDGFVQRGLKGTDVCPFHRTLSLFPLSVIILH